VAAREAAVAASELVARAARLQMADAHGVALANAFSPGRSRRAPPSAPPTPYAGGGARFVDEIATSPRPRTLASVARGDADGAVAVQLHLLAEQLSVLEQQRHAPEEMAASTERLGEHLDEVRKQSEEAAARRLDTLSEKLDAAVREASAAEERAASVEAQLVERLAAAEESRRLRERVVVEESETILMMKEEARRQAERLSGRARAPYCQARGDGGRAPCRARR
jgi:hypothetical protein